MLGVILEEVSGLSFAELIEKNITKPLQLKNTGVANNEYVKQLPTKGHQFKEFGFFKGLLSSESGEFEPTRFRDQSNTYSTGGMYSTVDDLLTWTNAIKSSQLLSKELTMKMLTPNLAGYGYG